MLDDTISRTVRNPMELVRLTRESMSGQSGFETLSHLAGLTGTIAKAMGDRWLPHRDPLRVAARRLGGRAEALEQAARARIQREVEEALAGVGVAS
jgi:hypothetical protein